ncbi:MAG TPA: hypothetical protein PK297_10425 [Spirochaetota bacterium]|nr:hypothetical protein [Spirochaetota bacterium]
METGTLIKKSGYLLSGIGGRTFLVDSGIPFSVGRGTLELCGRSFRLVQSPLSSFTPASISKVVDVAVDGIIGGDILRALGCRFDLAHNTIVFDPAVPANVAPIPCQPRSIGGTPLPVITIEAFNRPLALGFDSGSPLAYVMPGTCAFPGQADGSRQEYVGMLDAWSTVDFWNGASFIGGDCYQLEFAILPEPLPTLLRFTGAPVDGLFGSGLAELAAVTLAAGWNEFYVEKYAA